MRPGELSANLVEARHGGPDLPRLTERADLNHDRMLLAGELEARDQVRGLTADSEVGAVLPARCRREKLPQPLPDLLPNLPGFQHVSLTPVVSASAETLQTTERACQAKTYESSVEELCGDRVASQSLETTAQARVPIESSSVIHLAGAALRPHHATSARRSADDQAPRSGMSAATSDIRANARRSA